jgi:hypothetical protein
MTGLPRLVFSVCVLGAAPLASGCRDQAPKAADAVVAVPTPTPQPDTGPAVEPPAPLPPSPGPLQVCGILDADKPDYTFNSAKLEDFPQDEATLPGNVPGPFTMQLEDDAGRVLSQIEFGQVFGHAGRVGPDGKIDCHSVEVSFSCMNIPWIPGATTLVARKGDLILERFTRSPNAPVLTITAPTAGQRLRHKGQLKIAWEASDADGDNLSHSIYHRPEPGADGEHPWKVVIGDFSETEMELEGLLFDPGPAPELMVLTTDRFNTTRAVVKLAGRRP